MWPGISGTVGATTLSVEQLAGQTDLFEGSANRNVCRVDDAYGPSQKTRQTGGSQPHTHSLSGVSSEDADSLPPDVIPAYRVRRESHNAPRSMAEYDWHLLTTR